MLPINADNYPHGVVCGCDCNCSTPLADGNAMEQDVTDDGVMPWEKPEPDAARVFLLICVDCFTGKHRITPTPERAQ